MEKRKKCLGCGRNKQIKFYYKSRSTCKMCWRLKQKDYYYRNKPTRLAYAEEYRDRHGEELKVKAKKWRVDNPEKVKAYNIKYWRKKKKWIKEKRKEAGRINLWANW